MYVDDTTTIEDLYTQATEKVEKLRQWYIEISLIDYLPRDPKSKDRLISSAESQRLDIKLFKTFIKAEEQIISMEKSGKTDIQEISNELQTIIYNTTDKFTSHISGALIETKLQGHPCAEGQTMLSQMHAKVLHCLNLALTGLSDTGRKILSDKFSETNFAVQPTDDEVIDYANAILNEHIDALIRVNTIICCILIRAKNS